MNHVETLLTWYERMVDRFDLLTVDEQQALRDWENSPQFTRTSDWPGWKRHLPPRPRLRLMTFEPRRRAI